MNVTLRHLRAAVAVADQRSFRRAAEAMHLSQPALSLAISELEAELGVRLFDRTSRSVVITQAGESFVPGARRVLADFERLVQETGDIAKSRRGRVVVSCVSSIAGRVIPLALAQCAQRYAQIDVTVHDDVAQGVLSAVRAREADFGLTIEPAELGEGMSFEALHQDRFHGVFPKTHPLAARKRIAWKNLSGEHFIALSTTSGTHQMIRDEMMKAGVKLAGSTPVSHLSTVHGMLEAGFGISVLPVIALPVRGHPTLVSRPLVAPALSRTIGVLRRDDRSLSPAASTFVDVLRSVLRSMQHGAEAGSDPAS